MSVQYPLPRSIRQTDFVATDGQSVFGPVPWLAFDLDDVRVRARSGVGQRWVTLTSGFTVSLSASPAGFASATFAVGQVAGRHIRIEGARTHARITDVTRGSALVTPAMERELDKMSTVLQELRRDMSDLQTRVLLAPEPEAGFDFPSAAERLGKVPIGNGDGGLTFIDPTPLVINVPAPGSVVSASLAPGSVTLDKVAVDVIRTPIYAALDLFVAAAGSDANPGTSLGQPFQTIDAAWAAVRDRLDGRGQQVRFNWVGLNNKPGVCFGGLTGFTQAYVQGYGVDLNTPSTWDDVDVDPALSSQALIADGGARLHARGFKVKNTAGNGLVAWQQGAVLNFSSIDFGAVGPVNGSQIWATRGGQMTSFGRNVVTGGGGALIQASHGGQYRNTANATDVTFTASGAIVYAIATAYVLNGSFVLTNDPGGPPIGGAFQLGGGASVTGKAWRRDGAMSETQCYGLQDPNPGDLFGTFVGVAGITNGLSPRRRGAAITPVALSLATTHDWHPVDAATGGRIMRESNRVRMSALGPANLSGLFHDGCEDGQEVTLQNIAANTVTLLHNQGSVIGNRFGLPAGANVAIPQFGAITMGYDATLGLWIPQP